eukprot:1261940-Rhodomonas_salina.3
MNNVAEMHLTHGTGTLESYTCIFVASLYLLKLQTKILRRCVRLEPKCAAVQIVRSKGRSTIDIQYKE